jgi:hypothetical protein
VKSDLACGFFCCRFFIYDWGRRKNKEERP